MFLALLPGLGLTECIDILNDSYPAIGNGFQDAIALFLGCNCRSQYTRLTKNPRCLSKAQLAFHSQQTILLVPQGYSATTASIFTCSGKIDNEAVHGITA